MVHIGFITVSDFSSELGLDTGNAYVTCTLIFLKGGTGEEQLNYFYSDDALLVFAKSFGYNTIEEYEKSEKYQELTQKQVFSFSWTADGTSVYVTAGEDTTTFTLDTKTKTLSYTDEEGSTVTFNKV